MLLSVGHDEYWSWEMRDALEQARNRTNQPLNIGFFGANVSYVQIRFGNSSSANTLPANAPNRTIIAYKQHFNDPNGFADPIRTDGNLTNDYLTTNPWRDNQNPIVTSCPANQPNCHCPSQNPQRPNCTKLPEDELVGVMTDPGNPTGSGDFEFDLMCPAWVKAGMASPSKPFTGLVGYEADRIYNIASYTDRSWYKVAESDFVGKLGASKSHSVYYKMTANGARVFATGTIQWAWGLDEFAASTTYGPSWHANLYNPDVQVVTRNVLACLKDGGTACLGS